MNAAAFVVGPKDGPAAIVYDLAATLGFRTILPFAGVDDAERQAVQTPLCFFLFAEVPQLRQLTGPAQAIRLSPNFRVRFSPLIYLCRRAPLEMIRGLINMGFDDVITEPFSQQRVAPRLERQVETQLVYFETSSYFGPDRRHRDVSRHDAERRGEGEFRRFEIVRHLSSSPDVVTHDHYQQIML
jgi:hypothetical protein